MSHTLPTLPYRSAAALEPHIDAQTMQIHHGKHHAAYVNNLNAALDAACGQDVEELVKDLAAVPEDIRPAVRNNGGGHINHTMFWQIMGPGKGGAPTGAIGEAISATFGSFDTFKDLMNKAGVGGLAVDGPGWWMGSTGDHEDSPLMEGKRPFSGSERVGTRLLPPSLGHRRPDYLAAWWSVVNWDEVNKRLQGLGTTVASGHRIPLARYPMSRRLGRC